MARRNSAQEEPAGLRWVKSSASETGTNSCIEVAVLDGTVYVRDSKRRTGARLTFEWHAWVNFVTGSSAPR